MFGEFGRYIGKLFAHETKPQTDSALTGARVDEELMVSRFARDEWQEPYLRDKARRLGIFYAERGLPWTQLDERISHPYDLLALKESQELQTEMARCCQLTRIQDPRLGPEKVSRGDLERIQKISHILATRGVEVPEVPPRYR